MKFTNSYDFDFTENYMALLACILNKKLTVSKAISLIALQSVVDSRNGFKEPKGDELYKCRAKVIDTQTNKEYVFNTLSDCCRFLNLDRKQITNYIKTEHLVRGRYRVINLDPLKKRESKKVIVEDMLTEKTLEFSSIYKLTKELNATRSSINRAIKRHAVFRGRYKIELKEN